MKIKDIKEELKTIRRSVDTLLRDIDSENEIKIIVYEHTCNFSGPDIKISVLMVENRGAISYNHWIHSVEDHSGSARCLYQLARDLNPLDIDEEKPLIEYYSNLTMEAVGKEKGGPDGVYFINGLAALTTLTYYPYDRLASDLQFKMLDYIDGVYNGIKNSMSQGDQGTSGDSTEDLSTKEDQQLRVA